LAEASSEHDTVALRINISFHDPGICCPYTVSLGTAVPLAKYGSAELRSRFLPQLLRRDDSVWQGATWVTEIKGGSDLGAAVETIARSAGDCWRLTGDKYFASNAGAELALVAACWWSAPSNASPGILRCSQISGGCPASLFSLNSLKAEVTAYVWRIPEKS
jgi:alkylation response protein AidB-like acyl-CoA dehydrogenase